MTTWLLGLDAVEKCREVAKLSIAIQLHVQTIAALWQKPPARYDVIRLDTNNNCNLHCVYCHNERSNERIELDDLRLLLNEKVLGVGFFQIGCVMEPTLDPRLCDAMEVIAASPARPGRVFRLQTNATLLHRHDHRRMVEAGLNLVTISVDSIDGETHKALRDGTSLSKVQRNLVAFRKACPSVKMKFITTVTSANIDDVDGLIDWGLQNGIEGIELRQMFHYRRNRIVDHARMAALEVTSAQFSSMRDRVSEKFAGKVALLFNPIETTLRIAEEIKAASN